VFSPIRGKGNGRGISGFAVNRGAVNRGFTVVHVQLLANQNFALQNAVYETLVKLKGSTKLRNQLMDGLTLTPRIFKENNSLISWSTAFVIDQKWDPFLSLNSSY